MPMEPNPGLEPQTPFLFTPFDYTQPELDEQDGQPPRVGFYEPGIPVDDDPHPMYRFSNDRDYKASIGESAPAINRSRQSRDSSSSTGVLFPLVILIGAIWFAVGMPVPSNTHQSYTQEQQP